MNLLEISNKYPNEINCVELFEKARWSDKVICPFCNSDKIGNRNKDMRFHCKSCNKSFSVTTRTQIHNTRLPLKTWLFAFCEISNAKKGISALQLKRSIGVSYETAWVMNRKIRNLLNAENKDLDNMFESLISLSMLNLK